MMHKALVVPLFLLVLAAASSTSGSVQISVLKRVFTAASCALPLLLNQVSVADDGAKSIGDIQVSFKGQRVPMKSLLGNKATLVFNFAGKCDLPADGEPRQCSDLVKLYSKYKGQGLQLLAFPSEQFRDASMLGEMEPVEEIREDLKKDYGIDFPILDIVDVNGGNAADVYKAMNDIKSIRPTDLKKISWNFEKYLIDKDGIPVRRYRPSTMPSDLEGDITDLVNSGKLKPRVKAMLGAV